MPIVDINGKLVLSEIYKVNLASNGNGNLFSALRKANLIKDMEQKNYNGCLLVVLIMYY